MKVGVGYCDDPETAIAGKQAIEVALAQAGRTDPCDMVLLFSTASHDQAILRESVISVVGESVPIYGGGTAGVITNECFGYAGDQIGVACIWLDGVHCDVLIEDGLKDGEEQTGERLGRRLAELMVEPNTPVMLFYDPVDTTNGFRLLMATWLLDGIEKGLGFHPQLSGIGMIGDHSCAPTDQWIGDGIGKSNAIALVFSGDIRMDSVIIHGCYPSTQYYTVTKSVGQVILEINGEPAIPFIDKLLGSAIPPEQYPFFLIFGVNHGERWGEFNEDYYASRLCLDIDKANNGIVMFEPDMVEGTEFQLMFRSLDLDYIKPKIEKAFEELELDAREPVFAIYANCAGRAAGYAGADLEDAVAVQQTVAGRVPILGLYNGVEIAPIGGRSRGLDWTGVFCLLSQSKDRNGSSSQKTAAKPVWGANTSLPQSKDVSLDAMVRINEQNAAKILALDTASVAIRLELEQKRRGFALLTELAVTLLRNTGDENVFITVAKRISAALNMQRTIVLEKGVDGFFSTTVLQGYSANEKAAFAGRRIEVPAELLDPVNAVLVTGADSEDRFKEFRELFGLPYFTSSPVMLQGEVFAVLITGRLVEAHPYLVRLSRSDRETVQALSALLSSVLIGQRLIASEERNRIMVDTMPLSCVFWDENGNLSDCNQETLFLFGLSDKEEFFARFFSLSPEYQPDGRLSRDAILETIWQAFVFGDVHCTWTYLTANGKPFPAEITLIRVPKGGSYTLAGYIRDLRDQDAARQYAIAKSEFLASISHEIRTPLNAIQSMAHVASKIPELSERQRNLVDQGIRSTKLLTSAIETILDFSKLDSGHLALEITEFSVRNMVNDICGMVRKNAKEKSLYIRSSVDPAVPEFVQGDSVRLQQILFNIVANAIKFTKTGGVNIRVLRQDLQQEENGRNHEVSLVFEVRDTGIGISEDHQSDLFKPLFSSDTTYTRKYSGMGMGLAICNSLATLMGGKITCESRLNKGSVFRVFVPLTLPEEKAVEASAIHKISHWEALHGMRVLVAEDNKVNQMIMKELLTSVGIEVTLADNGIAALKRLREKDFDLVLMDIQMPKMDGLTATTQIRSDPRYDNLPIIAVTANAGPEHEEESRKAGMNDHLTKPVDVEKLYGIIKKWGRRSRM